MWVAGYNELYIQIVLLINNVLYAIVAPYQWALNSSELNVVVFLQTNLNSNLAFVCAFVASNM